MKSFDVSFGPDYSATLRPTPEGRDSRGMSDAVKSLKADPFPDHNTYLRAKRAEIADWARAEFDPGVAERMVRFLRTGTRNELATLTQVERDRFDAKCEECRAEK
jgi:hypothetical protein